MTPRQQEIQRKNSHPVGSATARSERPPALRCAIRRRFKWRDFHSYHKYVSL
jgi:hypothetical protein